MAKQCCRPDENSLAARIGWGVIGIFSLYNALTTIVVHYFGMMMMVMVPVWDPTCQVHQQKRHPTLTNITIVVVAPEMLPVIQDIHLLYLFLEHVYAHASSWLRKKRDRNKGGVTYNHTQPFAPPLPCVMILPYWYIDLYVPVAWELSPFSIIHFGTNPFWKIINRLICLIGMWKCVFQTSWQKRLTHQDHSFLHAAPRVLCCCLNFIGSG